MYTRLNRPLCHHQNTRQVVDILNKSSQRRSDLFTQESYTRTNAGHLTLFRGCHISRGILRQLPISFERNAVLHIEIETQEAWLIFGHSYNSYSRINAKQNCQKYRLHAHFAEPSVTLNIGSGRTKAPNWPSKQESRIKEATHTKATVQLFILEHSQRISEKLTAASVG
jgi:hypothetical protein